MSRLSYANVVASLALFIALGGTSYAAVQLSKNSVRSTHIKNGQVRGVDVARNAIDASKVQDGSLLAADFKLGQMPVGATGPAGPRGLQGPPGATGKDGPQGPAGPGALKLLYDQPNSSSGEFTPLATIGGHTLSASCYYARTFLAITGGSSGTIQIAGITSENDSNATPYTSGAILTSTMTIRDTGNITSGSFRRDAGTAMINEDGRVLQVTYHLLTDYRSATPRCQVFGTAIPAT